MPGPGIITLDLGIKLGWCRVDDPDDPTTRRHGVVDFAELHPQRWNQIDLFARWVTRELQGHPIGTVGVEEPFTAAIDNVGTRHVLHGMFTFVQVIGLRLGVDVRAVSRFDVFRATVGWCTKPAPERKTPSGRPGRRSPTKTEIRKAINVRHGLSIRSEDEADAVAILDMMLAELAGTGMPGAAIGKESLQVDHGEMVPPAHGESLPPDHVSISAPSEEAAKIDMPVPPALAQLREAEAAVPLEALKAPARRKLERELAKMGLGAALLPKRGRKVRGRGTRPLF